VTLQALTRRGPKLLGGVEEKFPVNGVGDVSLERPERFDR